jgi:cell wall-associated NlpC family hydrolase
MPGSLHRLKLRRGDADLTYMGRGRTELRYAVTVAITLSVVVGLLAGTTTMAVAASPTPNGAHAAAVTSVKISDLRTTEGWANPAINYVAATNVWMRDFAQNTDGTYPFHPNIIESRKYFARSVVKAFAPNVPVDTQITFTDLPATDPFYRWMNLAVKMGWMSGNGAGAIGPDAPVLMSTVHRALVLALGLRSTAQILNGLHTADATKIAVPFNFGTTLLGMRLGLRHDSSILAQNVNPNSPMMRFQVAYSLYKAKKLDSWVVPSLQSDYANIVLPHLGPAQLAIVNWGVKYVGYPYIWAGEWGLKSPEPSGLGGQTTPGFDCSGLAWWLMRADDGGLWNISPPRPYTGWSLPQRVAGDMAAVGAKIGYKALHPGDLMFFNSGGGTAIDHVDVYIGDGFSLDSSGSPGGVTIMPVSQGYYRDNFVHGRRLLPTG